MFPFLLSRLLSAIVVVLGVVLLVASLIHWVPGDPVDVMLGESAHAADRAALRDALGLNRPVWSQVGSYLGGVLSGDLGHSLMSQRPVTELMSERIPASALLAGVALLVGLVIAVPLGVLAAMRPRGGWDQGAMGFALLGASVPNFALGPILILIFSLWLGWFPIGGDQGAGSLVLPAVTLGTAMAAVLSRMVRGTLLDVLGEDYVRTARAKGLSAMRVIVGHGLRNALLPVITLLGLQLGTLLGGAVITEAVFSWPGLGQLLIEAIQGRDYPVVQGCVLVIALIYVTVNVLTDLVYAWVDPRIRLGSG
ncbi:MAG: ABC transporter permease [Gammaproteobacteria bacterium]